MRSLAVISMHTSPLVLPGSGDSGGMNVYVRELVSGLAQAGVESTVYVRRWRTDLPTEVEVEPGFRVVHVDAGRPELAKHELYDIADEFAEGIAHRFASGEDVDALHANYWLSGVVGHRLKHEFGLPLVSTFHTLARVKAISGEREPRRRDEAEAEVIGCSDVILASCETEAAQLVEHYGARPERIEIVPPGVDHAFFSPGDRRGARRALGLGDHPVLLFVGRIQPLKGLPVAIKTLALLEDWSDAHLLVVGGPSGPAGHGELELAYRLVRGLGLVDRVRFVEPQPHHLLSTYYRAADVCLVPSRSESFGLVALEAAACGTPVVAANVGGLTTLVDHGVTGFLVEERDPEAFARYVREILVSPSLADALGAEATRRSRRYTWSTTAGRLRRIYSDLTVRRLVSCA
ncbi:MAG: glycosyltransferase [Acidimicrobiales bacterium]|nr:glycosyltransferase [Acidimicrobiales bacterium]